MQGLGNRRLGPRADASSQSVIAVLKQGAHNQNAATAEWHCRQCGRLENGHDVHDEDEDMELAVDIVESVRLGTGARITCLAAWCKTKENQIDEAQQKEEIDRIKNKKEESLKPSTYKRKLESKADEYMDADTIRKARSLVKKAKKLKSKREKKKKTKKRSV